MVGSSGLLVLLGKRLLVLRDGRPSPAKPVRWISWGSAMTLAVDAEVSMVKLPKLNCELDVLMSGCEIEGLSVHVQASKSREATQPPRPQARHGGAYPAASRRRSPLLGA